MSLILEALKKSETERRLGRAPGLLSPTPRMEPPRRRPLPLLLAAALLLVVAGAGGAWWWLQGAPATEESTTAATAPAVQQLVAQEATRATPPTQNGAIPDSGQPDPAAPATAHPTQQPGNVVPPPPVQPARVQVPADPGFRSVERESVAVAAQAAPPQLPVLAPAPAGADATQPGVAPPQVPAAPVTADVRATPGAGAAGQVQPVEHGAPTEPSVLQLPSLRQLPADVRAELPPLKLSMHVFSEQPEGRFVLIDGRRMGEGAAVAEGLVVEEIRRDGVVMARQGRRFLLPRPG